MTTVIAMVLIGALTGQRGEFSHTPVQYVEDAAHGVVCYYIPAEHCIGDCAYSPAIACVRIEEALPACPALPAHDVPFEVPFARPCR